MDEIKNKEIRFLLYDLIFFCMVDIFSVQPYL